MAPGMTWEEMFAAIAALGGDPSLRMRKPGDWYVLQGRVEVKHRSTLESRYGNGTTPAAAVVDHWQKLTTLAPGEVIVVNAFTDDRRAVRWNGYMWADEPASTAGVL